MIEDLIFCTCVFIVVFVSLLQDVVFIAVACLLFFVILGLWWLLVVLRQVVNRAVMLRSQRDIKLGCDGRSDVE